jgi:hypothetical protein
VDLHRGGLSNTSVLPRDIIPENRKVIVLPMTAVNRSDLEIELQAKRTNVRGMTLANPWLEPDAGGAHLVKVRFSGDWSAVTSNPLLVFEATTREEIVFS